MRIAVLTIAAAIAAMPSRTRAQPSRRPNRRKSVRPRAP